MNYSAQLQLNTQTICFVKVYEILTLITFTSGRLSKKAFRSIPLRTMRLSKMCPLDLKSITAFFCWSKTIQMLQTLPIFDQTWDSSRIKVSNVRMARPWGEGTCWHGLQWRKYWACRPVSQNTAQPLLLVMSPCQRWCSPWKVHRWFQGNPAT